MDIFVPILKPGAVSVLWVWHELKKRSGHQFSW